MGSLKQTSKPKNQGNQQESMAEEYTDSESPELSKTGVQAYQETTATAEEDNSSQYEDIDNDGQQFEGDEEPEKLEDTGSIPNLLTQKLFISNELTPQFHQFYDNFSTNVDYIIQYEYNILPQQRNYHISQSSSCLKTTTQVDQKERDMA